MKRLVILGVLSLAVMAFSASMVFGFPAVEVYQKTSRSVVLIVSSDGSGNLVGAGSVVSPDGLIVTNAHVVIDKRARRPYQKIQVFIKPDEVTGDLKRDLVDRHKAKVVVYDIDLDLALIRAYDLPRNINTVELANPRDIMVGEEVVAIGHPEQGGLWTLTYGRISGQIANQNKVTGKDVYQTDTSVNRGNSGGPLLDRRGYLVGVNTNIARLGADNLPITGVNFALKSEVVKQWLGKEGYQLAYGRESMRPTPAPVPSRQAEPAPAKTAEPEEVKPSAPAPAKIEPAPVKAEPEPVQVKPEPVQPKPKKVEPVPKRPEPTDESPMTEAPEQPESDTILTPKRPFTYDDLFEEVEREMEDIMDEMRMKIRRH